MTHFGEAERMAWLAFLNSPEGRTGLAYVREAKRPVIRSSSAPHEMQFDLGAQAGFDKTLSEIEQLARLPTDKTPRTADRPPLPSTRRE